VSRRQTNAAVLGLVVRDLRRDDRLDGYGEMLATLAGSSARLVDEVCGPDSTAKEYAQAAVVKAHLRVVTELAAWVPPAKADGDDPWQKIADALDPDHPASQESDKAEVPDWDLVEAEVAKDLSSWPSTG
jgi:hypothetical protein